MTPPFVLLGALTLPVLGLYAGFAVTRPAVDLPPHARDVAAVERRAPGKQVLAQLGLDAGQQEQIEALRARERSRVETLQRALDATEQELRRAELARPFDAERVNELVARQAELMAYLRGTESRVVSEIAALLAPEQQRRFAALREAGAASPPRPPELEPPAATPPPEDVRASGI